MKVPIRWLQDFIELPTTDVVELSYALDMLGLTVDGVEELSASWTDVLVGRVTGVAPHPDADKIRVCEVDVGEGPSQIICGAWNFDEGAMVAVARPGAVLPGGFEIGTRAIRGVTSNGMICSEKELGIGEDHEGILVLDGQPEVGTPFEDLIELPDVVLDIDVTPNRPDALSILGVARDLAAYYDIEYSIPKVGLDTVSGETPISVAINDDIGVRRFTAREIRGVAIGKAPLRIRHRLHKVGVRSISDVVDVTNYVMFELGHPLHAFDADSIIGNRLEVKRASEGETLVTLDGATRKLVPSDLIIYDELGPTSMSGTMGGERSEVSSGTERILMEAASWDPPTIMNMWRRHGLRSEAATRFERGVDPNLADVANQRASAMVAALTGGEVLEGAIDEVTIQVDPMAIDLTLHDVVRVLGSGFTVEEVTDILQRLGMTVEGTDPMRVMVPTYRPDVTRKADLLEEIARIHGFDKFDATLPTGPSGGLTHEQTRTRHLQATLAAAGLYQAIHLPFVGVDDLSALDDAIDGSGLLTVKNPLRDEEGKLRPTLLPGLLNSLRFNLSHGADSVALFETGRVFFARDWDVDPRLPEQSVRIAWAVIGHMGLRSMGMSDTVADGGTSLGLWRLVAESMDLPDVSLRAATQPGMHPGRTAEVTVGGEVVGYVGELSPRAAQHFELPGRVAVAELDLEPLVAAVPPVQAVVPSLFPHFDFDLSFVVPGETPVSGLVSITQAAGDGLVESSYVFDEFRDESLGDNRKAIAIRYRLRAPDRTLTGEEVAPVRANMIEAATSLGAELRGA